MLPDSYISRICIASARAWLYSSRVKVPRENALSQRRSAADKSGSTLISLKKLFDGWDVRETLAAQSRLKSIGVLLAAGSILRQDLAQTVAHN